MNLACSDRDTLITRSPNPVSCRVLISLQKRELGLFFPQGFPEMDGAVAECVEERDMAAYAWREEQIFESRPHILVTGWCTPPLPKEWVERDDFPVRYVGNVTGSVRGVLPRVFLEKGGVVTNWGDTISIYVAEHGLLLALAALRNLPAWKPAIRIREQQGIQAIDTLITRTLCGRRVGLHGFGRIARALITLLRPFNAEISVYSQGVPDGVIRAEGARACGSMRELFSNSEVLFECEALTPHSEGCVDRACLAALPDGAVFVNIARGRLVDEAALADEARSGRLRVATDVLCSEPVRTDSPFYTMENVIVSPHIGGPTLDRYPECGALVARNIRAYLRGEPLLNVVTLSDYDRAT